MYKRPNTDFVLGHDAAVLFTSEMRLYAASCFRLRTYAREKTAPMTMIRLNLSISIEPEICGLHASYL